VCNKTDSRTDSANVEQICGSDGDEDAHGKHTHFRAFGKSLQKEGLLAKPAELKWLGAFVGLSSKL
jgi:hypothetical protein